MITEVFNNIGEEEIYSESNNRYKKDEKEWFDEYEESIEREEKSPISQAKKEFLEELEDDSLTIDTCERVTKDWGNK